MGFTCDFKFPESFFSYAYFFSQVTQIIGSQKEKKKGGGHDLMIHL